MILFTGFVAGDFCQLLLELFLIVVDLDSVQYVFT